MTIIFLLAPFSVLLGLIAVGAFLWTLRAGQYEDIEGSAARILIEDADAEGPVGDGPRHPDPGEGAARLAEKIPGRLALRQGSGRPGAPR
ncbi:MAG: cbb3-type cytochrome oxidase assembly protein CcoS [Caulobacterales bacterium]|nr:cbb3-type cytochrome oxidase assembly protein CcoS [Caulobacterales bacterium]